MRVVPSQMTSVTSISDEALLRRAQQGDERSKDWLLRRYYGFVRYQASGYFLVGGDQNDLIQEGMIGLHKAIRDYRFDRDSSFRNFAELCIHRNLVTAIKAANRGKHQPLNQSVSFAATPASAQDGEPTLDEVIGGGVQPERVVIAREDLQALVACLLTSLSSLESRVLGLYLDDLSYEAIAFELGCDYKTVDNALQRVKRKVDRHRRNTQVLDAA